MPFARSTFFSAIVVAGTFLAGPALALDGQDFGEKLANVMTYAGAKMSFSSAKVEGQSVILEGINLEMEGEMPVKFDTRLVFDGVSETGDGGYTAQSARMDDIEIANDNFDFSLKNIVFNDITISADPSTDPFAGMTLYKTMSAGPAWVQIEGKPAAEVEKLEASTRFNDDQTVASSNYSVTGIHLDPSALDEPQAAAMLAAYGLTTIDAKFVGSGVWNLKTGDFELKENALDVAKVGKIDFTGAITGYDLELVRKMMDLQRNYVNGEKTEAETQAYEKEILDMFVSQLALLKAAVRYDDAGLVPFILQMMASQADMPPSAMGGFYGGMAAAMAAQAGLPEDLQTQVMEAVSAFFEDPRNITIAVNPEAPVAFSSLEAMSEDPQLAVTTLNPSIVANQ